MRGTLDIVGCRSDARRLEALDLVASGAWGTLRANTDSDRRELLVAARAGEDVKLQVTARTFEQRDGRPNRRFLRFESSTLAAVAASFVGMPVLLDHDTYSQKSRIGTILTSELVRDGETRAFRQTLKIVKPDAVISVLDGTITFFSIGWVPTGPVLCTVHGADVRDWETRCCWPGDRIDDDDGTATVEWEFTKAEGIEVSAVNVPAVKGTKIEDIRPALAAELGMYEHEQEHEGVRTMQRRNRGLRNVARQLGHDPDELEEYAAALYDGDGDDDLDDDEIEQLEHEAEQRRPKIHSPRAGHMGATYEGANGVTVSYGRGGVMYSTSRRVR